MRSFTDAAFRRRSLPWTYRSPKASKSAGHGSRGPRVCDMSRDAKLDLRTPHFPYSKMQMTPKALAALAHSGSPQWPGR